jgi:hypothetical protein
MSDASVIRPTSEVRTPRVRSAVTNGSRLHVVVPGDTKWARRFRDVLDQIIADLSGPVGLSEGQRQLARRATTIAIACERLEGEAAAGNEIDLEVYGTLTDRLGRCFARLGLKRQTRDTGLTLSDILREDLEQQRREHRP